MKDSILSQIEIAREEIRQWRDEMQDAMDHIKNNDTPARLVAYAPAKLETIKELLTKIQCKEELVRILRGLLDSMG